jgi:2'-5' RNA ligase
MNTPSRRLFIALPIDDEQAVRSLDNVIKNLNKYHYLIKTVPADNFHITLKFFGSVDFTLADSIADSFLSLNSFKKVEYTIKGIGAFPSVSDLSVIWAGLKCDEQPLGTISRSVETLASESGFPPEKRKFIPHLTLGRVKREKKVPQELKDYIVKERDSVFASSVFSELVLFESILKNTGAEYKKIGVLKLT